MEEYYKSLHQDWWNLKPNQRRTLRQLDLFKNWKTIGAKGYILAVTGFGKTRTAELAIEAAFAKNPNRIVNVLVPHNAAKEVWIRVKARSKNKRIRVCMAQTYLRKSEQYRKCDLLIIDECHKFTNELAELFGKVIDATDNKWILPLSATLTYEQQQFMEKRGIRMAGQVTMKEARECNYVAEHYNWIVQRRVTGKDRAQLKKISDSFQKHWKLFDRDMDNVLGCMAGGEQGKVKRNYYASRIGCNPDEVYGVARKAMSVMRERKVFLQKAPSKLEMVQEIVNMFPDRNILTFGEYTDFADSITEMLGPNARSFHSKLPSEKRSITKYKYWKTEKAQERFLYDNRTKLSHLDVGYDPSEKQFYASWKVMKPIGAATIKKENVAAFVDLSNPVRVLNTAKALDEAADIDNIDVAIIVSFSSTARQLLQRIGRAIRFKQGKIAHIFILCLTQAEGRTQEEKWLKEALAELDEYVKIHFHSIKDYEYA